ncbi:zeta toxin family protein [Paenibacillus polysaccharolyticus]|uniref:zeta toxin family protein n=1 Tax=Paenibacillus polysaccharolyticus TaxID=582692 RepID=UPI0020A0CD57|nr:zeta toxin family protein [Paenibacillus polysaccharolyticus]MCP1136295.1 zeta toxin family protein [Paenibacillus polysaccharolyticus]
MLSMKSKDRYSNTDGYIPRRKSLHEAIIQEKQHSFHPQQEPIAFLMGGGSASGKTWLRGLIMEEQEALGNAFLIIDADEIKSMLPEYISLLQTDPKEMAKILHDESSDIALALLHDSAEKKLNTIYDGTMKNYEKYDRIITKLKQLGYQVRLVIADVDIDEAMRRNEQRFQRTGRFVPVMELRQSHIGVAAVFHQLKDRADEYVLYDTFDGFNVFAYKTVDEGDMVCDPERLSVFLQKSGLEVEPLGQKSS